MNLRTEGCCYVEWERGDWRSGVAVCRLLDAFGRPEFCLLDLCIVRTARSATFWLCGNVGSAVCTGVLVVFLTMGITDGAYAQKADTSRSRATQVEPAELDSLTEKDLKRPPTPPSGIAESDTGEADRVYVTADSLSALQRNGERIQELFGNVFVRHDTTELRSNYAKRYLNRDELLFFDDVLIYERGDTLRADTVRYDQETEVGHSRGNVRLTDGEVTVRADRGIYFASEKRSVFPDSVVLVDSTRVLRAAHGTYWSDDRRAEFGGGVRLTDPGTTIHSDSLTFFRDEDRSIATGNVFIDRQETEDPQQDSTTRTYLFGNRADNQEQRRYSRVTGNALLIQLRMDSTGAPTDTLAVEANRLEAFRTDTHRRLVAVDSVRIWQPSLSAVADSVVYDRVTATSPDSSGQPVPIDTTRPPKDSLRRVASETTLDTVEVDKPQTALDSAEGMRTAEVNATDEQTEADTTNVSRETSAVRDSVGRASGVRSKAGGKRSWRTPTAQRQDQLPLEEIRLYRSPMTWFEGSQVWGDSIRVRARNRQPDTVFVRGSAFAAKRDSVVERIQQLKAHNLTAFFRAETLRRIRARPNAQAIRFLVAENDSLNGAAKTSGDRIVLRFADGAVRRVSVVGGVETTYYRKNQNIPNPFQLEGFQWVPSREPTRAGMFGDKRVRRWLNLDATPSRRSVEPVAEDTGLPRGDSVDSPQTRRDTTSARIPTPLRPTEEETGTWNSDSLRTNESLPPDSIPPPPAPPSPADTSKKNVEPTP